MQSIPSISHIYRALNCKLVLLSYRQTTCKRTSTVSWRRSYFRTCSLTPNLLIFAAHGQTPHNQPPNKFPRPTPAQSVCRSTRWRAARVAALGTMFRNASLLPKDNDNQRHAVVAIHPFNINTCVPNERLLHAEISHLMFPSAGLRSSGSSPIGCVRASRLPDRAMWG